MMRISQSICALRAAADGQAVDSRDERLGRAGELEEGANGAALVAAGNLEQPARPLLGIDLTLVESLIDFGCAGVTVGHLAQVSACGECAAVAGHDTGPHVAVVVEIVERNLQLLVHAAAHGVEPVRAVHGKCSVVFGVILLVQQLRHWFPSHLKIVYPKAA